MSYVGFNYDFLSKGPVSCGSKKFISATAVSDAGADAQALYLKPERSAELNRYFQISLTKALVWNYAGALNTLALAVRIPTRHWFAGQVTAAGVYTDDTTDAQDVGADDFLLHNGAESGSGFVVSCDVPFNVLGVIQGVAGDQVAPVFVGEYWDGTSWTAHTTGFYVADALNGATGERLLLWGLPHNWVKGGSGVGMEVTRYNMRFRQTNGGAGAANPAATQLFVGFAKRLFPNLTDQNYWTAVSDDCVRFPPEGDALFPVVSVAHLANTVEARVGVLDAASE